MPFSATVFGGKQERSSHFQSSHPYRMLNAYTAFQNQRQSPSKGLWLERERDLLQGRAFPKTLPTTADPPILKRPETPLFTRCSWLSGSRSSEESENFPEGKNSLKFTPSYAELVTQIRQDYVILTGRKFQAKTFTIPYFSSISTLQRVAY